MTVDDDDNDDNDTRCAYFRFLHDFYAITEPRGSVRPNVRDKDVNGLKRNILIERMVGLPCPVQGYPAPTFRYRISDKPTDKHCIVHCITSSNSSIAKFRNI